MPCANMDNIAGVVLAGGRSSRMEENKALLTYRGKPLVDHMVALLQKTGLNDIYISGDLKGYKCLPDELEFSGPAVAIKGILEGLKKYDGILIVPVDMPLLTPDLLHVLLQKKEGAYFEKRPLPALLKTGVKTGEQTSVKGLLHFMGTQKLQIPRGQEPCFANINTPQEWKEITS